MQPLMIPCPECGKELKLRDRSLLGRKGKCPQCQFRFVLQEPEEVELELADGDTPAVGTSPRWVPDEPEASAQTATAVAATAAPQIEINDNSSGSSTAGGSNLAARRRKQKNIRLWVTIGSTVSGMILAVLIAQAIGTKTKSGNSESDGDGKSNAANSNPGDNGKSGAVPPPSRLARPDLPPDPPPKGKPIALNFIPTGARMILHLRPADLWAAQSQAETVKLCLGSRLNKWLEGHINKHLLFEPSKIKEALICLYLDDKTRPPDVAYVVKFVEPLRKKSVFIEKFGGKRNDDNGVPVYVTDGASDRPNRAYMITDRFGGGFASVPASMTADMLESIKEPGLPNGGLEELLKLTDSNRHVSLVFNPFDLKDRKEQLFAPDLHDLAEQFTLIFDNDTIEAVAWSFHFGSSAYRDFYSEIVLRNKTDITTRLLQVDMKRKFDKLPTDVKTRVSQMRPEYMSERQLVSRLPLMLQAFHVETVPQVPDAARYIKLTTALPDIAGPNLAAAGMLAWRMSRNAGVFKPPPKTGGTKLPELIADRLKKKIDVDFRREPIELALKYIGTETSVNAMLDAKAFEDAGYTRNLRQTFKLDNTSAFQVLVKMVSQYKTPGKEMVFVIEEDKKLLIITTKKFAAKNNQKAYPMP